MLVSFIIPAYNSKKIVHLALDSIRNIKFNKKDYEVIVVDNGSIDGSGDFIKKKWPWVRIVKLSKNLGFAGGVNRGVRISKGKYIAILNDDLIATKDFLKKTIPYLEKDEKVAMVGPTVYHRRGKKWFLPSYYTINPLQFLTKNIDFLIDNRKKAVKLIGIAPPIFRKSLFKVPYDDEYFAYYEDSYLSFRALLNGYDILYIPEAKLKHYGSVTIGGMNKKAFFKFIGNRNRLMTILIFYRFSTIIKLIPLILIGEISLCVSNPLSSLSILKSHLWIITNFFKVMEKRKRIWSNSKYDDRKILQYMTSNMFNDETASGIIKSCIRMVNAITGVYLRLVGIKTLESDPAVFRYNTFS